MPGVQTVDKDCGHLDPISFYGSKEKCQTKAGVPHVVGQSNICKVRVNWSTAHLYSVKIKST